jgi:hypothetical protein
VCATCSDNEPIAFTADPSAETRPVTLTEGTNCFV